jgi:hypothetical protein
MYHASRLGLTHEQVNRHIEGMVFFDGIDGNVE